MGGTGPWIPATFRGGRIATLVMLHTCTCFLGYSVLAWHAAEELTQPLTSISVVEAVVFSMMIFVWCVSGNMIRRFQGAVKTVLELDLTMAACHELITKANA